MITKFKIFESSREVYTDEYDLAELFSQKFIEEYYDETCDIDVYDAIHSFNLWNYVDLDIVRYNLFHELADNIHITDNRFKVKDFVDYIHKNIKDVDISLQELKDMSREELIDLLMDTGEEESFILSWLKEDFYEDVHPEEIAMEIYGRHFFDSAENLYSLLSEYLDSESLIEDYRDKIDFENKFDYVMEHIPSEEVLQKKLLKMDPNTVDALFDVMESNNSIGDTYEFQKKYIEYHLEENAVDINDKEDLDSILPNIIKKIHDKYGLDPDIEKEYKDYTYLIDTEKYNL